MSIYRKATKHITLPENPIMFCIHIFSHLHISNTLPFSTCLSKYKQKCNHQRHWSVIYAAQYVIISYTCCWKLEKTYFEFLCLCRDKRSLCLWRTKIKNYVFGLQNNTLYMHIKRVIGGELQCQKKKWQCMVIFIRYIYIPYANIYMYNITCNLTYMRTLTIIQFIFHV